MTAQVLQLLTSPDRARRDRAEQISVDEYRTAGAVWGYLSANQREAIARTARVPASVRESLSAWVQWWPEIKGGIVWSGYDLEALKRAALGGDA